VLLLAQPRTPHIAKSPGNKEEGDSDLEMDKALINQAIIIDEITTINYKYKREVKTATELLYDAEGALSNGDYHIVAEFISRAIDHLNKTRNK
jgi:hypothetical protein